MGNEYFLQPGYVYIPDKPTRISTGIGSGLSVCIFDKKNRLGGMNNFNYPLITVKGETTTMYGNIAMNTLIRIKLSRGSNIKNLEAQLFGGAYNPDLQTNDIGKENIAIAKQILLKYQIPIVSEDIRGQKGRKIIFQTATNDVAVLKVDTLRREDWYPYKKSVI